MKRIIGTINPNKPINIVGAGVSGLLIAYYLKKAGFKLTIYEKSKRSGGLIHSEKKKEGLVETAANAILANDDVIELLHELKLSYLEATPKLRRLILRKDKPLSFPLRFFELILIFLKLFILKVPNDERLSLKEFMQPLLGKKVVDEVLSTAVSGIYASGSDELHYEALFIKPKEGESYFSYIRRFLQERKRTREKFNIKSSISFKNGMQEFIDELTHKLKDEIHYNQDTSLLDNCLICTNAHDAATLLQNKWPKISTLLFKLEYKKVITETRFYQKELASLINSFGVLMSRASGYFSYGILTNHHIFPRKELNASYTFIAPLKEDASEKIENDCARFGFNAQDFVNSYETKWEKAIPIYNYDRYKIIHELKENNELMEIGLFGNYVSGISIRDMIVNAKAYAQELKEKAHAQK